MVQASNSGAVLSAPSDQDALMRIHAGESAAFEWIMRRNNRRMYRIARGILRNDAEAEDAVQEAFVQAYAHLHEYRGSGSISAWLARITANEALGRLRRHAGRRNLPLDDPEHGEEADFMSALTFTGPDPEQSAGREEFRRLLERAIDALPDPFRIVFILRGVEEMSVAEASDCLQVEPATIKTRYHRARLLLQQHLAQMVESSAADAFPFAGERCDRIVAGVLRRLGITSLNQTRRG